MLLSHLTYPTIILVTSDLPYNYLKGLYPVTIAYRPYKYRALITSLQRRG
jgi:hypothetical protein